MRLDDFESVFRSAFKQGFSYVPPTLERVLLVTDLARAEADAAQTRVEAFLASMDAADRLAWTTLASEDYDRDIPSLLARIEAAAPDLIVTWRHLGGRVKDLPHSLGSVLDVIGQAATVPVLVLPPPGSPLPASTSRVMVVTEQIAGDDAIVNQAVHFCSAAGTCWIVHVEDADVFARYSDALSRLPGVPEPTAARVKEKLLQIARDYIGSIADQLRAHGISETIVPIVRMGHPLGVYSELLAEHEIDLLVLHAKDPEQQAMAGTAYPLAVELHDVPMLLI